MPYKDLQKKREYNKKWMRENYYKLGYGNGITKGEESSKAQEKVLNKTYEYPQLKIPENIRETQYCGYYITEDGKAYRVPRKCDRYGRHGKINEYGLIYLKPALRGCPGRPEHQYECVNISVRDENGKFLKQIKKSIHQLVAEVFIPNPEGHTEIDHIDRNNRNNHYKNLRWCNRSDNMKNKEFQTYKITDMISGQVWEGENLMEWARNNFSIIEPRLRTKKQGWKYVGKVLSEARCRQTMAWKLKIEY